MIIIGHRGAMAYEPENTLRGVAKALELGADMVEIDVYRLPSGELMVFHDRALQQTTNGHGYLLHHSFRELRKLDAGKGERIPTLQEVLNLVDKRIPVVIEIKNGGSAEAVAEVIDMYVQQHGWRYDQFLVSSFYHHEVQAFKRQYAPHVAVAAPVGNVPLNYAAYAEELQASVVIPDIDHLNKAFVDDAHRRGLKVYAFTIATFEDTQLMYHLGVDGVFSNAPDVSRLALESARADPARQRVIS